jgi:crotonobetainyl-CoA:carnitine CoA-transferase CaiB-like acyl-CoA transferase
MHALQAVQIAAGVVADAEDLCVHDPHLAKRQYWQSIRTADGGTQTLDAITPRLSSTPGKVPSPAAHPGDDTDKVLREILLMEQTEIDALRWERTVA